MLEIAQASAPDDVAATRDLIRELTSWAISLDPETKDAPAFGDLEKELAALPGVFAPPTGCLLLAKDDGRPIGCVGFCAHSASDGADEVEVKRMYVLPDQRGKGVGKELVARLIAQAQLMNVRRIVLDSYHTMTGAHRIYRAAGFRDVPAPLDFPERWASRVVFMELDLD